ncbi:hypothetical protein L1887_22686 [Cichorium endivia]|nr:hypothetical protein L1887_22686 [Cichorium endivia]
MDGRDQGDSCPPARNYNGQLPRGDTKKLPLRSLLFLFSVPFKHQSLLPSKRLIFTNLARIFCTVVKLFFGI